jgi:hypothetical protein
MHSFPVCHQGDFVVLLIGPAADKGARAKGMFRPASANGLHAQNVAIDCG